jgi:mRNA-degrading endonuclease toxin of MazEF toxin-antitoxin module
LLVVPVTSQTARVPTDVTLSDWKDAGLRLPSIARLEKWATIEKSCAVRKLGTLMPSDLAEVRKVLTTIFASILS